MSKFFFLMSLLVPLVGASPPYKTSSTSKTMGNSSTISKTNPTKKTNSKAQNTDQPLPAQSPSDPINLKTLMSPSEQEQAGIDSLSSEQLQSLETWFSNYIQNQKKEASQVASNEVNMVLSEGHYVKLGSGQVWAISPNAWIYTYYWQKGDPIEVGKSQDSLFPISLTNKNSGQSVNAKKPSKDVSQAFSKNEQITKIANDGQFITLSDGSSWQVEPSARYMAQGWSKGDSVFVVQVKNSTGSPYELYNGTTSRSVFVSKIKSPMQKKTPKSTKQSMSSNSSGNSSNAHSSPLNQTASNPTNQTTQG